MFSVLSTRTLVPYKGENHIKTGPLLLPTGYTPVNDSDAATKLYVDEHTRLPTGYTPANDYDAATKLYVDEHSGGSTDVPQERIIYLSTAGAGDKTQNGLTLNTAFSTLGAAISAANDAATETEPVVIYCEDLFNSTGDLYTLGNYVSIWGPNMQLGINELTINLYCKIRVRSLTVAMMTIASPDSAENDVAIMADFINLQSLTISNENMGLTTYSVIIEAPTVNARITALALGEGQSPTGYCYVRADVATLSYEIGGYNRLYVDCASLTINPGTEQTPTPSTMVYNSFVSLHCQELSLATLNSITASDNAILRCAFGNQIAPQAYVGPTFTAKNQIEYSNPIIRSPNTMTFVENTETDPQEAISACHVSRHNNVVSIWFYIHFSQHGANTVVNSTALEPTFCPGNPTTVMCQYRDGAVFSYCSVTLSKTGDFTIGKHDGTAFDDAVGDLYIGPCFLQCDVTELLG